MGGGRNLKDGRTDVDSAEKLHSVPGFCRNDVEELSRYEIANLEKDSFVLSV